MAKRDLDQWLWLLGAGLDQLSEEMSPRSPKLARCSGWAPPVDVVEADHTLVIRVELAGVDPADVRVGFYPARNVMVLRGVRREQRDPASVRAAHQLEINYGEFVREIRLPDGDVDLSQFHARYRDGILTITVPKPTSTVVKTISIETRS